MRARLIDVGCIVALWAIIWFSERRKVRWTETRPARQIIDPFVDWGGRTQPRA